MFATSSILQKMPKVRRGCQNCSCSNIPKWENTYQITTKYTKLPQNIPNYHKIYQITTKYTKLPQNIPNGVKIHQMELKYTKWT
jgi:hypothetical protein